MSRRSSPPSRPAASSPGPYRVPPHSQDAETAVLGAVFLDPSSIDDVIGMLRAEDFYKPANAEIYTAMLTLQSRHEPVDILTVSNHLTSLGKLEMVGGASYLSYLADAVPSAANIEAYAKIVQNLASLRSTIRVLSEYTHRAYEPIEDIRTFMNRLEADVLEVATERSAERPTDMRTTMREVVAEYERAELEPEGMSGLALGFKEVDSLLLGLRGGDSVVVAARPSVGKSALVSQVVLNAGLQGVPGAIFTLEMSRVQFGTRMLVQAAQLPNYRLRRGQLSTEEALEMVRYANHLGELPIGIYDNPSITMPEIAAQCRRFRKKHGGLGVIAIDYLQLVTPDGRSDNREGEVAKISRQAKILAKQMDCPVILVSQLSRKVEGRAGKRMPEMQDLRESGGIEQDADIIIFLHREWTYNPLPENQSTADLLVAKQRNGSAQATFALDWNFRTVTFHDPGTMPSRGSDAYTPPDLPPEADWAQPF